MKKYLLITAIFLVMVSGCSKSVPKEEVPEIAAPEEIVLEKTDESKQFVYVEIPENAKDLNDYAELLGRSNEKNIYSNNYPYLEQKDINGGTERIVLNFKSSDAHSLQIELDESTQKSLNVTDKFPPEYFGGEWASFQVADLAESDEFVSFTTLETLFPLFGDSFLHTLKSYVFDKVDGSLVSQDDVIKRSGYSSTDFETAFIKSLDAFNESLPEQESYSILTYKPEYFAEDFDSSTLSEEVLETFGLHVRIKPEEGIVVNEDGSLTVIYEEKYFYGLSPGSIDYGLLTIPAP